MKIPSGWDQAASAFLRGGFRAEDPSERGKQELQGGGSVIVCRPLSRKQLLLLYLLYFDQVYLSWISM